MPKTVTSVQCTRCGHEISLATSTHMYVVKLHKCKRCGKTWFPRSPGTPRICPTRKTTYWGHAKKGKENLMKNTHWFSLVLTGFLIAVTTFGAAQSGVVYLPPFNNSQGKQTNPKPTSMTVDDVIKLSKAGLSDDLIIVQIKKRPLFDLSTDQLIQLKSAKVSDRVIQAMTESLDAKKNAPGKSTTSCRKEQCCDVSGPDLKTAAESSVPKPVKSAINDLPHVRSLADGFYYKAPEGWQELEPIMMSGGGAKHVGKMFVPGLTPQMVSTFRGAAAPIQISEKRPTFYVKTLPSLTHIAGHSGRDLVIVRFDKKKDHRELQTTNGGNMFTFKAGLSKDRLPDIQVKTISDGVFSVTPTEDLKPGEYLLTFDAMGMGANGCDFGITQ